MNKLFVPLLCLLFASSQLRAQTFTTLYSFQGMDGALPEAGLVISNNTLYGTTTYGGTWGNGTVFKVNTDGSGFTNLHVFTGPSSPPVGASNNDGALPFDSLVLAGDMLYGTTHSGGSFGRGTIFAVHTDGAGFTNLHSFAVTPGAYPYTNSDGHTLTRAWFWRATHFTGRPVRVEVRGKAPCSRSTPTARVSQTCTISRRSRFLIPVPTAMEPVLLADFFWRTTYFMEQRQVAVVQETAWCSPSTPTAPALPIFIISRRPPPPARYQQ